MLRRVACIHCVHYIGEKDCTAIGSLQGLYGIYIFLSEYIQLHEFFIDRTV